MASFDDILNELKAPQNEAWEGLRQEASFRPIIFIGLGGFGCTVIRKIKRDVLELLPDKGVQEGFSFIGLDTHPRERNDVLSDTEYVPLSVNVIPGAVASDPQYAKHLTWYRELMGKFEVRSINAANKVRPVGRLSFLYPPTLNMYYDKLQAAVHRARRVRERFGTAAIPKVYVVSSLAGGTGSGVFLDLFALTSHLLQAELSTGFLMQALLATPDALMGEQVGADDRSDFFANTYAALKEMLYVIMGSQEIVSYGIAGPQMERFKVSKLNMPHNIFLITDSNSAGKVVINSFKDLGELVRSYLLFEILTPLVTEEGQPKVHDGENPSYDDVGHGNMPRALSSIGVVRFGLPYNHVEDLFVSLVLRRSLAEELGGEGSITDAESWIADRGVAEVGTDQLQEKIRLNSDNQPVRVYVDAVGRLSDVTPRTEYCKASEALLKESRQTVQAQIKNILSANSGRILAETKKQLEDDFSKAIQGKSLGSAIAFITNIRKVINSHNDALTQELLEHRDRLQKAEEGVNGAIGLIVSAAGSGMWGRKGKIQAATSSFDADLNAYLNQQVVVWSQEEGLAIYKGLLTSIEDLFTRRLTLRDLFISRKDSLEGRLHEIIRDIDTLCDVDKRGDGNRFSIIDSRKAVQLYGEYVGTEGETAIVNRTREHWRSTGILNDAVSKDLEWLAKAEAETREEIKAKLRGLNLLRVLEKFYPEGEQRDELLDFVMVLGSPLFPLDPGKKENLYKTARVVALHPGIRQEFLDIFRRNVPSQESVSHAYFSSPHEAIVYTISHGYTAHSLSRISNYRAQYDSKQGTFLKLREQGRVCRSIHAWVGTEDWDEPMPKALGEDEAIKWFAVGRTFASLFPEQETSYIYKKGTNYNLIPETDGRPAKIGNGLESALENFEENTLWQKRIETVVTAKIEELGRNPIKERLEKEYMPILEADIEQASRGKETSRHRILRDFRKAINLFIARELKERKV